jgi:hypothetical protein
MKAETKKNRSVIRHIVSWMPPSIFGAACALWNVPLNETVIVGFLIGLFVGIDKALKHNA